MKKLLKAIGVLLTAFCLFGCENPANEEEKEKDNILNMTSKVDDVVLKYNDWGSTDYSFFQSDAYELTELFEGKLPEAGESINFYWKGKCNRNVKKLHILVFDINPNKNEGWRHLLLEKQNVNPIVRDIKANEEFEITRTITLDKTPEYTVWVALCCGAEDTDGPVHLYSTETENTEQYDEYMNERGNAILNSPIKVEEKGKITFYNSTKSFKYTKYPKIKLADGKIYDCSKTEEKNVLLEKGYFYLNFASDYTKKNEKGENIGFLRTTSNNKTNSCGHASWEPTDDDFKDYDISYLFDEDNKNKSVPLRCDCLYFALADENAKGTTEEEKDSKKFYYYFPLVAFDFVVVEE